MVKIYLFKTRTDKSDQIVIALIYLRQSEELTDYGMALILNFIEGALTHFLISIKVANNNSQN